MRQKKRLARIRAKLEDVKTKATEEAAITDYVENSMPLFAILEEVREP